METFSDILHAIGEFFSKPIFSLENSRLTVGMIIYLVVGTWLIFFISKLISRVFVVRLLNKYGTERGVSHAIGTIFRDRKSVV